MKAHFKFNGLRACVAFVVVIFFTSFTACHTLDPIEPIPGTKVPTVSTVSITKLTPASVEVNAEIVDNGGENITAAGICWIAGVAPTIQSNLVIASVKSGAYTATVDNLQQKTAYYFRAFATNKNGTAYGDTVRFYDGSVVTPVKAFAAARPATKVTMTTARIAAVIVPMQADTKASFEYQTSGTSWKKFDLFLALEGKNLKDSIKVTFDLSDLVPNTFYSFRINASNSAGEVTSESYFTTCAVADLDGNMYHEIQIGDQIWLQENLRTTKYANGDPIANVTDPTTWGNLTTGAYCWYNNDPELGKVYGGLYNFYVGADTRKLIKGYHVPTLQEWDILDAYLGTNANPTACQLRETGIAHWAGTSSFITNSTGFTALPNGDISGSDKNNYGFTDLGSIASFWTSSLFNSMGNLVTIEDNSFQDKAMYDDSQKMGLGIRLIKDVR